MGLKSLLAEDFCCYEQLRVKLKNRGLVWIGGENFDTKAANSNGSGKSTIFKCIGWAAYGKAIDGEDGDKVIRNGSKCARTTLRTDDGWTIVRERRKGAPKLYLYAPESKEPIPGDRDEIQGRVDRLLGMDWNTFRNTVLYGQRDTKRFSNPGTKDSERKDILHRILGTDLYKYSLEWLKVEQKRLRDEMATASAEVRRFESLVESVDMVRLKADVARWDSDQSKKVSNARLDAKAALEKAAEVARSRTKLAKLEKRVADLTAKRLRITTLEESDEAEAKREDELSEALDVQEQAELEAAADVKAAKQGLLGLDGDKCPKCSAPLKKGEAAVHIKELKKALDAAEREVNAAQLKVQTARVALETQQEKRAAMYAEIRTLRKETEELGDAKAELAEAKSATIRRAELKEAAARAIESVKTLLAEENPHKAILERSKTKLAEYEAGLKTATESVKAFTEELAHYEFWARGFGPSGLPSFDLDATMPYLTERVNHYLEALSDGDISVCFSTQRELRSTKGEFRDEIAMTWEIEGVENYPPSGGQWKKIEVATDFALMDLVASTGSGGHMDLLLIDEGLDGLDKEGRDRILQLLHKLRSERGSVFVVSQEDSMAEIFERQLIVAKRGGKTELRAEAAAA